MTLDEFLSSSWSVRDLRAGPFKHCIDLYADRLRKDGYSKHTAASSMTIIVEFFGWLTDGQFGCGDVDEQLAASFLEVRVRRHPLRSGDPAAIGRLLSALREAQVIAPALPRVFDPTEQILEDFHAYLTQRHGLRPRSCKVYVKFARPFLRSVAIARRDQFARLTPADVLGYVERRARDASAATAVAMCSRLRSFLRYLHVQGLIATDLAACVPSIRKWRFTGLPTYLSPAQLQQVFQSCDLSTAAGRRDHAVLLLLARLGLRAQEVATITLDDIDWHSGLLTIQGKGQQQAIMPLPPDVGAAIAAYLCDGRPPTDNRTVFLHIYAGHAACATHGISDVARRALKRAGIDGLAHHGSHVLRHTLATELLRSGATLTQIGQVLRHRNRATTCIYAKVDLTSLRTLCLPWPGAVR